MIGDMEMDRRAWALAAYKLTYDDRYREAAVCDWSQVDLDLGQAEESDLSEELTELQMEEERFRSYAWLFRKELLALRETCQHAD